MVEDITGHDEVQVILVNMANSPKLSHLKEGKHIQKSYVNGKWWDSQDSLIWPWVSLKMRYIVYPQVPNLWQLEREEHDDKAWKNGYGPSIL